MSSKKYGKLFLLLFFLIGSLMACDVLPPTGLDSTSTATPSNPGTPPLNQWIQAKPGVDLRYEDWKSPSNNEDVVTIVRFDIHRIHLKVAYQATHPMSMHDWMQQEQATAIINGGYFDQQDNATGLVISNGQVSGTSYDGFGGMLSVDSKGAIKLRSLRNQPYDPGNEQLQQATQSSPMLIVAGKRTQFDANAVNQRRSIVATDKQGRLLFIASPGQAFSLDELADILVASDLSIETALNLDGGASTGLYMNAGSQHISIDSFSPLPIVIVVK